MFRRERRSDTPPPTPVEQFRRDAKFTLPTATQGQSPLLTLPAEIQRMIFTELLGKQLVHVHLRHRDDKYEREGAPRKVSRWVHCVCCLERNTVPHYHEEKNHRWCFLSTNILRTCQSALPLAQIQIFVPGDLDKRTDEAVRVEASPDKRDRISIITHAKDPFSGCCGEILDEEAEQRTDDNVEDNGLAVEESGFQTPTTSESNKSKRSAMEKSTTEVGVQDV
ncbi:hypothetical protein FSPOR_6532 [Fusarium sporotrichioides]|uniref:DUF7730 domain-containing protein n=1 Tax=Fusarium sporotrichioides TaxID=5514 RepID=A0A395S331_FUSSP|nr:hypothetical protein FSPOR_6532 [Fusarium sporotrichioides]